jgi:hypothetical protein
MKRWLHRSQIANRRRRREPWKGVRGQAHGVSRGFAASQRSHPAGAKDFAGGLPTHRFLSPLPGLRTGVSFPTAHAVG